MSKYSTEYKIIKFNKFSQSGTPPKNQTNKKFKNKIQKKKPFRNKKISLMNFSLIFSVF